MSGTHPPDAADVTRQDVLKVFDAEGGTLTTREVADALEVTPGAARYHLKRMADNGDLQEKGVGDNRPVWIALVAPELAADSAADIDDRRENGEFAPLPR
jgi:hypothetical protein